MNEIRQILKVIVVMFLMLNGSYSMEPEWITFTTSNSILRSNFITALAKETDNTIWVGTFSHTVTGLGGTVRISGNSWSLFDTTNSGIKNNTAISIVVDNNNNKWFGCALKIDGFTASVLDSGGYSRYNGTTWSNWQSNLFWSDNIQDLSIDRSNNNLWSAVGTFFIQGNPIHGTVAMFNGSSWTFYNRAFFGLPNNNSFRSILVDNNGIKWIGTINNGLIRFDGTNFTIFNNNNSQIPSNNVYDLEMAPDGTLWVGTDFGLGKFNGTDWTVYRTSNSGLSYNLVTDVAIENNNTIWVGTLNSLMKFDGNSNWTKFDTANSEIPGGVVDQILVDNLGNKWIGSRDFQIGKGLTVFREGGVVGLNNSITTLPQSFLLRQNYPNPFNPSTIIEFEIPKENFTELKIYDLLGKEVEEIVSAHLNHGRYTYSWDAGSLPAGVYFSKLTSGNFTDTKKMVLVK